MSEQRRGRARVTRARSAERSASAHVLYSSQRAFLIPLPRLVCTLARSMIILLSILPGRWCACVLGC
eukprot:2886797-Alexandrium_andersonii.AAC.1